MSRLYKPETIKEIVLKWMEGKPLDTKELLYHKHSNRIGMSEKKFLEMLEQFVCDGVLKEVTFYCGDQEIIKYYCPANLWVSVVEQKIVYSC